MIHNCLVVLNECIIRMEREYIGLGSIPPNLTAVFQTWGLGPFTGVFFFYKNFIYNRFFFKKIKLAETKAYLKFNYVAMWAT